jgi:hypothetical protein
MVSAAVEKSDESNTCSSSLGNGSISTWDKLHLSGMRKGDSFVAKNRLIDDSCLPLTPPSTSQRPEPRVRLVTIKCMMVCAHGSDHGCLRHALGLLASPHHL